MSIHQSTPASGSQSVPSPNSAFASTTHVISTTLPSCRFPALPVPKTAAKAGESLAANRHGDQDHRAVDDQERTARQIKRRQKTGKDGEHKRARYCTEIMAAASEDRSAADRDSRNRGEQVGIAHAEI